MTQLELDLILQKHKDWLDDKEGGEQANLRGANLRSADLRGANLSDANLWGANLRSANLRGANLRGANLRGANLWGANLWGANLSDANLWGADLRGANLSDANLWGANLWGANGNNDEIKSLQTDSWTIVYTATVMQIGCERHNIFDWLNFDDDRIESMDDEALEWWQFWKPILVKIFERQGVVMDKAPEETKQEDEEDN